MKNKLYSFFAAVVFLLLLLLVKQYFFTPAAKKQIKTQFQFNPEQFRNCDLIFQTSLSSRSKAIQLATKSKYSHCGIIWNIDNKSFVLEAIEPVKLTSLQEWVARGKEGAYTIKRLKNADEILTPSAIESLQKEGEKYIGKHYDVTFEWNDDRIYCSELIWKIYKRALGIEIGQLQQLKEFDLTNEIVQKKMKERFGNKIPFNETVISPEAIYNSPILITVQSH